MKLKLSLLLACAALSQVSWSEPCAQLSDPLEWLFPDSAVGSVPPPGTIDVPGNGVVEMNVLPVPYNTGIEGNCAWSEKSKNPYVTRKAPFRVYDAMEPLSGESVMPSSATTALRFRLRKPAIVGERTLRLDFSQGSFRTNLGFRVNVHAVNVPPVGKSSFKYTNWVNYKSIAGSHGLKMWSPEHWRMIASYVRLAVYGRQNTVILPWIEKGDGLDDEKYVRLVVRRVVRGFGDYSAEIPLYRAVRHDLLSAFDEYGRFS